MAEPWIFRRRGAKRFTYAWAPNPAVPSKRQQVLLPEHLHNKIEARRYVLDNMDALRASVAEKRRPASSEPRVRELFDRWEKLRKNDERKAWSTVKDSISAFRAHALKLLGDETIDAIDVPKLREFVREVRKTRAAYTVRNALNAVAIFFDDIAAERWARLPYGNPALHKEVRAELPEMRPRAGRSHKLRIADVALAQKLLDCEAVPLARRVRYAIALTSGARDGEIAGYTWAQIHLEAEVPHTSINAALQLKHREGHAKRGKTKTFDSMREMPLHPAAIAALKEWRDRGWENHTGLARTDAHPVFANGRGAFWRPKSAKFARADMETAGLPTHVDGHRLTFQALRRSFASWLRAAEVPGDAITRLLGHVPRSTADAHYAETDLGKLAGFVARIGLVWRRVQSLAEPSCDGPLSPSQTDACAPTDAATPCDTLQQPALAHTSKYFLNRWPDVRIVSGAPENAASCAGPNRVLTRSSTRRGWVSEWRSRFEDHAAEAVGALVLGCVPFGALERAEANDALSFAVEEEGEDDASPR